MGDWGLPGAGRQDSGGFLSKLTAWCGSCVCLRTKKVAAVEKNSLFERLSAALRCVGAGAGGIFRGEVKGWADVLLVLPATRFSWTCAKGKITITVWRRKHQKLSRQSVDVELGNTGSLCPAARLPLVCSWVLNVQANALD